jgi:hypothetical protein
MNPPQTPEQREARRQAEATAAFIVNGELRRAKFIERLRLLAHQENINGKPALTEAIVEELIGLAY